MFKFIAIAVALSFCLAIQAATTPKDTPSTTIVAEELNEYLLQNPHLKVVAEMERSVEDKSIIRYKLGKRVDGDRLVEHTTDELSYTEPLTIKYGVDYPLEGSDRAKVTYVQIDVKQDTDGGQAYLVSGGIGHREIRINIFAKEITSFKIDAQIFGK